MAILADPGMDAFALRVSAAVHESLAGASDPVDCPPVATKDIFESLARTAEYAAIDELIGLGSSLPFVHNDPIHDYEDFQLFFNIVASWVSFLAVDTCKRPDPTLVCQDDVPMGKAGPFDLLVQMANGDEVFASEECNAMSVGEVMELLPAPESLKFMHRLLFKSRELHPGDVLGADTAGDVVELTLLLTPKPPPRFEASMVLHLARQASHAQTISAKEREVAIPDDFKINSERFLQKVDVHITKVSYSLRTVKERVGDPDQLLTSLWELRVMLQRFDEDWMAFRGAVDALFPAMEACDGGKY